MRKITFYPGKQITDLRTIVLKESTKAVKSLGGE